MATEIPIDQLLGALLDAQNQCNALLGEVLNKLMADEDDKEANRTAQSLALDRWKAQNQELSHRCKQSLEQLGELQKEYMQRMLDDLSEIEPDNEFQVREFIDKYGQGFLQLNGVVQTISQLAS